MDARIPPLRRPPIGFGHRGARAHAPDNTIASFQLALKLGATGLESDVWLTADGVPVLDHDGVVRRGLRRRAIADLTAAQLGGAFPSLAELFERCGADFELSLDVKDEAAFAPIVATARDAGAELSRVWLCHPTWPVVAEWRKRDPDVRLVDSTRLRRMKEGPERRGAALAEAGIDAVNLPATDWTGGLVALFHRFERYAFAWNAQHDRVLDELMRMGLDGVYSDHVDRMTEAIARAHGDPPGGV